MGPTQRIEESQRLSISAILRARPLEEWTEPESVGEQLHSREPDSYEIHHHRDWHLPTERVQCTQLPTYERMER